MLRINLLRIEGRRDPHEACGIDLCPICGLETFIVGRTKDGRLIGACLDAFTQAQWNDDE